MIIDYSKQPPDFYIKELYSKLKEQIEIMGGRFSYEKIKIDDRLDYNKEHPEIVLKYNTHIVFHQTIKDINHSKHPILPKVWNHLKDTFGKYSIKTLVGSIKYILTVLTDIKKAMDIMNKLKKQVNDSLNSISIFRNILEIYHQYIHYHCLVIAFYLDHYKVES